MLKNNNENIRDERKSSKHYEGCIYKTTHILAATYHKL